MRFGHSPSGITSRTGTRHMRLTRKKKPEPGAPKKNAKALKQCAQMWRALLARTEVWHRAHPTQSRLCFAFHRTPVINHMTQLHDVAAEESTCCNMFRSATDNLFSTASIFTLQLKPGRGDNYGKHGTANLDFRVNGRGRKQVQFHAEAIGRTLHLPRVGSKKT